MQCYWMFLPISVPSVNGVSFLKMMELVGLLPWKTFVKHEEIILSNTKSKLLESCGNISKHEFIYGH